MRSAPQKFRTAMKKFTVGSAIIFSSFFLSSNEVQKDTYKNNASVSSNMVLGPSTKTYTTDFNYLDQIAMNNGAQVKRTRSEVSSPDIMMLMRPERTLSIGSPGARSSKSNSDSKTVNIKEKLGEFKVIQQKMIDVLKDSYASEMAYQFDISVDKKKIISVMDDMVSLWLDLEVGTKGYKSLDPINDERISSLVDDAFNKIGVNLNSVEKKDLAAIYSMIFYRISLLNATMNSLDVLQGLSYDKFLIKK